LAQFYTRQDRQRADSLALQFAELAVAETDVNQLARYRLEVADMASTLARRSSSGTVAKLHEVVTDRFPVALAAKERVP